jgi:hypothetical protein
LVHQKVEPESEVCPGRQRLGPYATAAEAAGALQHAKERNEEWTAQDREWEGEN